MKLSDYKELLKNHDWYFERSDDPSVYRSGRSSRDKLIKYRNLTPKHTEAYINYKRPS